MSTVVHVGNTVTITKDLTEYRIVSIVEDIITLCKMNTSRFELVEINKKALFNLLEDESAMIGEYETNGVIDVENLPKKAKDSYYQKKAVIKDVRSCYGHNYIELNGKKKKTELEEILKKHRMSKYTFWRMTTRFFQSGFDEHTLIDERYLGVNTGKTYSFEIKGGRKSEYFKNSGVIIDDRIREIFDEALKEYKKGRHKSLKSVYDKMNNTYFSRTEVVNGVSTIVLLPVSERPTMKQFYYYASKKISPEEKEVIKTSKQEYRNNSRLLLSDTLYGVLGPGDMVEIDACEADVSLVSTINPNCSIGRPIVYFMIDVYTRIILAVSVALDNNSYLGITGLFLNLADDKKEYCKKYGIEFDDDRLWPSNIIPNRIRVDRGAECKGEDFKRLCVELGIEKDIVPGGTGSLKGVIEQSFHQMHVKQNVHLEDKGLIEKRHDSRHHEEARLTIYDYIKIVINFVLIHNQTYFETYPTTADMDKKGVLARPAKLWEYGIENCMNPRPIRNMEQYLFDMMSPVSARISRAGIEFKDLFYISEDPSLTYEMMRAGNKKIPFEVRMDKRNVGAVYYISDGRLIRAALNPMKTGNMDYDGITMFEYERILKEKKKLKAKGTVYNQELSAYNFGVNEKIVAEAARRASNTVTDKKNMRYEREIEKQKISAENSIDKRLELKETPVVVETEVNTVVEEKIQKQPAVRLTSEEKRERYRKALQAFKDEE